MQRKGDRNLVDLKKCRSSAFNHVDSQLRECEFRSCMAHREGAINEEGNGKLPRKDDLS